jgi:hypothetical protein
MSRCPMEGQPGIFPAIIGARIPVRDYREISSSVCLCVCLYLVASASNFLFSHLPHVFLTPTGNTECSGLGGNVQLEVCT